MSKTCALCGNGMMFITTVPEPEPKGLLVCPWCVQQAKRKNPKGWDRDIADALKVGDG